MLHKSWLTLGLVLAACGGDPGTTIDEDPLAAARAPLTVSCLPPLFAGDVVPGGYRTNDEGNECILVSKYNADVSAGCDMSGADWKAFKKCVGDCQGKDYFDASKRCIDLMMACQRELCGTPFETDMNIGNPTSIETWTAFLD